jgi:hypothetical protein
MEGQLIMKDFAKTEYDIIQSFRRIEEKLIDDIIANLDIPQKDQGLTQHWRVDQLKRLEQYRIHNRREYTQIFEDLNHKIEQIIRSKFYAGLSKEEKKIMQAIANGFSPVKLYDVKSASQVYDLNQRKLDALIKATMADMKKAEYAVLRRAEDAYRHIIFDAEVALNTGSLTYKEAIDMAAKDFLASGIQCIQYKNGARHKISDYCDMAVKTADTKAYLTGEGEMRKEHGCHLVIVNKRGDTPCEKCLPFIGKILVDDVYSGGTKEEARRLGYPLLSEAIRQGLYHPRCRDIHTTYFPELDEPPKPLTKKQKEEVVEKAEKRKKESYERRQAEKYKRMSRHSLDKENKQKYKAKQKQWQGA